MRSRVLKLAQNLSGWARSGADKAASMFTPFRRNSNSSRIPGLGNVGAYGNLLGHYNSFDPFGTNRYLEDIGQFNPLYVEPHIQILMRRSLMPRLALILMASALKERQYVVEGASPEVEAFHQKWVDRLLPQILKTATNSVWYGWQPYILDWTVDDEGMLIPFKAHDIDPFTAQALETEEAKEFRGVEYEGIHYDLERSFKLTWEGHYGNHYGESQALTVYPYWWAWSVLLMQTMQYYERSVDPVRMAFSRNVQVPTGEIDSTTGKPVFVDLSRIMAEALDVASGGDSVGVPLGEAGEDLVKIEQLDLPDRADTFLKMLAYLEEKQFTACLALPGIGLASSSGGLEAGDARIAEKTQLRMLEYITDQPVDALNSFLLPHVHRVNKLPGPSPVLKGKAFKREQEETFRELFKAGLEQVRPVVGPDGKPTSKAYRAGDLIRWDKLAQSLDYPLHSVDEVAREEDDLLPVAPGKGGRPRDALGDPETVKGDDTRAEERAKGMDR